MPREQFRRPARREPFPEKFRECRHKERFARRHERGPDNIARPMRAEINPRPTDRPGQNEIKPAPPAKKQNADRADEDRKSTRLNSSHVSISYAVFCLKKKKKIMNF